MGASITEVVQFLLNHWVVSSSLGVFILLFLVNELRCQSLGTNELSTQQAVQMMNHDQAVFVDIRAPDSFAKAHVIGAINLPNKEVNMLSKYKSKSIILGCANGLISPKMVQQLKTEGFEQVYFLTGGIEAWQRESLPLTQK